MAPRHDIQLIAVHMTRRHDCRWAHLAVTENREDRKKKAEAQARLLPGRAWQVARICRYVSLVGGSAVVPCSRGFSHVTQPRLTCQSTKGCAQIERKQKYCLSLAKQRLIAFVSVRPHSIAVQVIPYTRCTVPTFCSITIVTNFLGL